MICFSIRIDHTVLLQTSIFPFKWHQIDLAFGNELIFFRSSHTSAMMINASPQTTMPDSMESTYLIILVYWKIPLYTTKIHTWLQPQPIVLKRSTKPPYSSPSTRYIIVGALSEAARQPPMSQFTLPKVSLDSATKPIGCWISQNFLSYAVFVDAIFTCIKYTKHTLIIAYIDRNNNTRFSTSVQKSRIQYWLYRAIKTQNPALLYFNSNTE